MRHPAEGPEAFASDEAPGGDDAAAEELAALLDQAEAGPPGPPRAHVLLQAARLFELRLGDVERALVTAEAASTEAPGGAAAAEVARLAAKLAESDLAQGRPAAALDRLTSAIDRGAQDPHCHELAIVALGLMGEPREAHEHRQALLRLERDDASRLARLLALAALCRQHGDLEGALAACEHATTFPGHEKEALHELLEHAVAGERWQTAVDALRRLSKRASGRERATLLVAAAKILDRKLAATEAAVEACEEALDEAPDDTGTFDRLSRMHIDRGAWRDLEKSLRRMIKRLGSDPPPELRGFQSALWQQLGQLYETQFGDPSAASVALEVATNLAHTQLSYAEIWARIRSRGGNAAVPA